MMKSASTETGHEALQGGSSRGGYQIEVGDEGILNMVCWGVWDQDAAHSFKEKLGKVMRELKAASKTWFFSANFENFPPQGGAVAKVQGELMKEAMECGMQAAAAVVTSAMTKLQIQRIAEEHGMHALHFFGEEQSAHSWLLNQSED